MSESFEIGVEGLFIERLDYNKWSVCALLTGKNIFYEIRAFPTFEEARKYQLDLYNLLKQKEGDAK